MSHVWRRKHDPGRWSMKTPPPAPLLDANKFYLWSFYRAIIAEFVATLLFLYVTVATVIRNANDKSRCGGLGTLGITWSFGGMIFVLVYCTAGVSGGHLNPAVTFGMLVARKVTLNGVVFYMVAQCLGAICGAGMVKALQKTYYSRGGGGVNSVSKGYANKIALAAEMVGTFVLVNTIGTCLAVCISQIEWGLNHSSEPIFQTRVSINLCTLEEQLVLGTSFTNCSALIHKFNLLQERSK